MIARVLGPTRARALPGLRFIPESSTSAKTGSAPAWRTALAVAMKEKGVVTTSVPWLMPRACRVIDSAAVPEAVETAYSSRRIWRILLRTCGRSRPSQVSHSQARRAPPPSSQHRLLETLAVSDSCAEHEARLHVEPARGPALEHALS